MNGKVSSRAMDSFVAYRTGKRMPNLSKEKEDTHHILIIEDIVMDFTNYGRLISNTLFLIP